MHLSFHIGSPGRPQNTICRFHSPNTYLLKRKEITHYIACYSGRGIALAGILINAVFLSLSFSLHLSPKGEQGILSAIHDYMAQIGLKPKGAQTLYSKGQQ